MGLLICQVKNRVVSKYRKNDDQTERKRVVKVQK